MILLTILKIFIIPIYNGIGMGLDWAGAGIERNSNFFNSHFLKLIFINLFTIFIVDLL